MPFKSEAQRRYLWMKHPDVAREFSDATPKGAKLPDHVKQSHDIGTVEALARFGFRTAAEELRLKIPTRTFHGFDAAKKSEAEHAHKRAEYGDRRSSEALAEILSALEEPPIAGQPSASKNPLDRSTSWGPPANPAAGDTAGRAAPGPSAGFGGI